MGVSVVLIMNSVCAIRTPLGVDRKILSIRKEPMLSGFLTLNAQSILPHAGNICLILPHAGKTLTTLTLGTISACLRASVYPTYSTIINVRIAVLDWRQLHLYPNLAVL